jgi:ubiquinone biosynthesis UbiH/UbiF/VisC/COQ6 family hydroxylase
MNSRYDVAIAGGGIVGAMLALLLAARARVPAAGILLLEPQPANALPEGAPFELRVSALAPGQRALLQELGVWALLPRQRVAPYECMVVWHEAVPPDSPDVLRFDAAEMGEPDLGIIVENRALQAALLARCAEIGVNLLPRAARALQPRSTAMELSWEGGGADVDLLVGADGAASAVRGMLGIEVRQQDYGQRAIVANVRSERGHQHTAWQRFLASGPLALLPLANGDCSIVWSAREARAAQLLALSPAEFSVALTAASAGVVGRMELISERVAFPLRQLWATRYVSAHAALVGDAAHVVHPLAGQGVNLGIQDAVTLADVLAARPARESLGAQRALLRYQRAQRARNALATTTVDAIDRLFTNEGSVLPWIGREGMALVGRSAVAKRFFVTRAAADRSWPRR